jgi:hypothetical protein
MTFFFKTIANILNCKCQFEGQFPVFSAKNEVSPENIRNITQTCLLCISDRYGRVWYIFSIFGIVLYYCSFSSERAYVKIKILLVQLEVFLVNNSLIYCSTLSKYLQAVLGGSITVPTLTGDVSVKVSLSLSISL